MAAILAGAVVTAPLVPGVADAASGARGTAPVQATTVSWGATLLKADGTLLTGAALSVSVPANLVSQYVFASARNTGTVALTGETYTLTATGLNFGQSILEACTSGSWQSTTNTCTGTTTKIATANGGATSSLLSLAVGASLSLRVTVPATLIGSTVTVSASASRAQVRAATTVNS